VSDEKLRDESLTSRHLHRTLDLKCNPMDSFTFENNLNDKYCSPATRANVNEPGTQQSCGAWSRSNFRWLQLEPKNYLMVKLELEICVPD